jgi:hypothetical protein
MIPTKRARRLVAALAVPAILLPVAACGSEEQPEGPVATVSGKAGEEPEISFDEDARAGEEVEVEVVDQGDGAEVQDGDFVRADVVAQSMEGGTDLVNTWQTTDGQSVGAASEPHEQLVVQMGDENGMLPTTITEHLVGVPVGSRVKIEGRAGDLLGETAAQVQLEEDTGMVWVFDIAGAATVDPRGQAEGEQAETAEGMPTVEAGDQAPAIITIPEGTDPPSELQEQVLIEGDGPEVTAGQGLIVQYTGVTWADGEVFDSSWNRDAASSFQIGIGRVVAGWDQGLVGKNVGDRVLLVIPPDLGYGDQASDAIPAGSTLVFVVDIVGAV